MSLAKLVSRLQADDLIQSLAAGELDSVVIPSAARAFAASAIAESLDAGPLILVTATSSEAERVASDIEVFLGSDRVDVFPAWETLPFERVSPAVETMGRRMRAMYHFREGHARRQVLVASIKSLVQRLGPHVDSVRPLSVALGQSLGESDIASQLASIGYRREYQVEHRGEFSVRGSIVDVFPSTSDSPIRIDLWGDEVDRLGAFSVSSQRSAGNLERVEIFPARELLPDAEVKANAEKLMSEYPWAAEQWEKFAEGAFFDGMESWLPWLTDQETTLLDLCDPSSRILLLDPKRIGDRAVELVDEETAMAKTLAGTWGAGEDDLHPLHLSSEKLLASTAARVCNVLATADSPETLKLEASGWDGSTTEISKRIGKLVGDGFSVVVCADGTPTATRISDSLRDENIIAPVLDLEAFNGDLGALVIVQSFGAGFVLPKSKLAVVTESDLTGRRRAHRRPKSRRVDTQAMFNDLKPGDFVVHYHHGVGRYMGMVTRSIGGSERDYLLLEYKGDDKLYIPSDQIDAIRAYTGGDAPSLSRLGGTDWSKTKEKVRRAVREIAQELLVLYQKRVHSEGHAFSPDTPWQREMEAAFPFHETPDQVKAIIDVKEDMELASPMDRLVCGDVGFGKTEVAIRAVFKAVQDGMQVAVLVPTTLLAQQHFQTFSERFAGFPVRVEVLSRFLTAGQAKTIIKELEEGKVDVVIGTHRLLSGDVKFKNLGLLVIDEEQRFGVMHKESIKKIRANVDALTLTATPIPRTLEMSLTGIRDLTLLNTPPAERQPILTYVGEYDDRAVTEAVRRELLREGQVFFVHNRVSDIEYTAERIREMVPEARVAVAHGQMDEGSLEKVVLDFWNGDFDVLVCTTIIESGIDMPSVNTLVVDRADLLGLGQLHQLRGRVGRAGQRAYAYLFYPQDRTLTEEAFERLRTIGEHTELGSGFKIAMRDLEIRGAGNMLSGDQSGHIAAVGYDLYVQMVTESVSELRGEEPKEPAEIKLDLPVKAFIPASYIEREDLRLDAYRRLAVVETNEQVDEIRNEWTDRFGPVPPEAEDLLTIGMLRSRCARIGVNDISVGRDVRISPIQLKASAEIRLKRLVPRGVYKDDQKQLVLPKMGTANIAAALVELLDQLVPADEDAQLTSAPV